MQAKHFTLLNCLLFLNVSITNAETFKCVQNGKSIISDSPCMLGAARVDQIGDNVTQEQRRQAEVVNYRNRRQLAELEYKAAQDRASRGGIGIYESPQPSTSLPPRR